MTRSHLFHGPLLALAGALLLGGCAAGPSPRPPGGETRPEAVATPGERIATAALAELGKPYRYGGNGPDAFDCSGLVRYVHLGLGIEVPRTTADQFRAARAVAAGELALGDLLFFRIDGPEVSHVAIYAGDGRFVHAPQTGRPVEARQLADPWYGSRLAGVGRLY